jgi:hypothetical protein
MAEREEGLWMSGKERERVQALHEVEKRHISQKQAAGELRLSMRWVRELLLRLRAHGDGALRLKRGIFYFAEVRKFLLCVDRCRDIWRKLQWCDLPTGPSCG